MIAKPDFPLQKTLLVLGLGVILGVVGTLFLIWWSITGCLDQEFIAEYPSSDPTKKVIHYREQCNLWDFIDTYAVLSDRTNQQPFTFLRCESCDSDTVKWIDKDTVEIHFSHKRCEANVTRNNSLKDMKCIDEPEKP